jgi:hypothetical protein
MHVVIRPGGELGIGDEPVMGPSRGELACRPPLAGDPAWKSRRGRPLQHHLRTATRRRGSTPALLPHLCMLGEPRVRVAAPDARSYMGSRTNCHPLGVAPACRSLPARLAARWVGVGFEMGGGRWGVRGGGRKGGAHARGWRTQGFAGSVGRSELVGLHHMTTVLVLAALRTYIYRPWFGTEHVLMIDYFVLKTITLAIGCNLSL